MSLTTFTTKHLSLTFELSRLQYVFLDQAGDLTITLDTHGVFIRRDNEAKEMHDTILRALGVSTEGEVYEGPSAPTHSH